MNVKNNGGSAFPLPLGTGNMSEPSESEGMSLRDWFAGKAMTSILVNSSAPANKYGEMTAGVSRLAYLVADAMIAARASSAQPAAEPEPTEPDADGWIEWAGGECPIPVGTLVDAQYANGGLEKCFAGELRWDWQFDGKGGGDIVRYRVVEAKP